MLEGDPPFSNYEPYEAAKYVADGHRPAFRKGHSHEVKEYVQANNTRRSTIATLTLLVSCYFSILTCFSCCSLVELCWSGDISLRPSFLEILKRLEKLKEQFTQDNHWHLFQ